MSKIGKALLSTAMIAATAATFASTTYAFVVLEKEANVDQIEFDVATNEGLLISIDKDEYYNSSTQEAVDPDFTNMAESTKLKAKNFYQDLSASMIEASLKANRNPEESEAYNAPLVYQGVTMKAIKRAGEFTYKGDTPGFEKVTNGVQFTPKGDLVFEKDTLAPKQPTESNPYRSEHELVLADSEDYVKLDLTFRLAHQGEIEGDYELVFTGDTKIESKKPADTLELLNSLYTVAVNPARESDGTPKEGIKQNEWKTGEVLTVDPKNAMRIAVVNRDTFKTEAAKKEAGDTNLALTVYEPYAGLGSAAIEGFEAAEHAGKGGVHDKTLNAMYTYHNNVHPFEQFTAAATAHTGFDTKTTALTEQVLGTFEAGAGTDKDLASYNDLHLSVYVYLEGWDADFFTGISNLSSEFTVDLGFEIRKKGLGA